MATFPFLLAPRGRASICRAHPIGLSRFIDSDAHPFLRFSGSNDYPSANGAVETLWNALNGAGAGGPTSDKLTVFWDKRCLK